MSPELGRVNIPDSERQPPRHERLGPAQPAAEVTVSVYLRGPEAPPGTLAREEFASSFGATEEDIAALGRFAAEYGLQVGDVDRGRRRVELTGSVADLAAAFGTELALYRTPEGHLYRGRVGALSLPQELDGIVTGVFGLDERPQAEPHFRPRANARAQYTPPQVAGAYGFPAGLSGSGECVAIVELGGGFRDDDLTAYFSSLGLAVPAVTAVSVDGGQNAPGQPSSPDGEVMLDIEVIGGVAPGAAIAVYFAPNTDQGFIDAVTSAAHDTAHRPSVISISWGSAESTWTAQSMNQMEQAFAAAAAMGVTVTVAAGDNGSTDGVTDGLQHVDFPASAPHALGCGGTHLGLSGGQIGAEIVWNDGPGQGATGGGVSDVFAIPSYQQLAGVPSSANPGGRIGRGVPDIAGNADPDSGYTVRVDGETVPIGGTSAVAPLWAGLVALLNEGLGRPVGWFQPFLYSSAASSGLRDIVEGSNGAYSARPGWDPCTGLGSPIGAALLAALRSAKPS